MNPIDLILRVKELEATVSRLVTALEAVLGDADLESADGCDDVQRCVVCRKEYDLDDLMDDETETQFQCRNPECAAGKARRLLQELGR
jgi:hypothetical protein